MMALGNEALANVGVQDPITDVNDFFLENFYVQFFSKIAPNFLLQGSLQNIGDQETENPEEVQAQNV